MRNLHFILILMLTIPSIEVWSQSEWKALSSTAPNLIITDENVGYYYTDKPVGSHGHSYSLFKSTDGCRSFTLNTGKTGDFGCYFLDRIYFVNSEIGFMVEVCQGIASILKTNNGGQTWEEMGYGGTWGMALCFLREDFGYFSFVAPNGTSYFNRNNETVFMTGKYLLCNDNYLFPGRSTVIEFINDSIGCMTTSDTLGNAVLLKTINYGVEWSEKLVLPGKQLKDITFMTDSIGIAVGSNGLIFKTIDQGETWDTVSTNAQVTFNSIDFTINGVAYIAGEDGIILKSDDYGNTWAPVNFINTSNLIYIRVFENNIVYVNDADGNLYTNYSPQGISELGLDKSEVYPNPASDRISVTVPPEIINYVIRVTNIQGKVILNSKENEINISILEPGMYILTIESEKGVLKNKFLKQ